MALSFISGDSFRILHFFHVRCSRKISTGALDIEIQAASVNSGSGKKDDKLKEWEMAAHELRVRVGSDCSFVVRSVLQ